MEQRILITGASGFVGQAIIQRLLSEENYLLRAAVRSSIKPFPDNVEVVQVGGISGATDWYAALQGVSNIIHAAARVHILKDNVLDPLEECRRVNVTGTLNLARKAAAAGVKRFVFLSSIKVNGESTSLNQPYTCDDKPAPIDSYGVSKQEAEVELIRLAEETGMEVVIIRPPLVYGPGVKANFHNMMRWLYKGVPLPFGAIHNKRSLVALDNLVDLIITCISHPAAANQIFLVSDDEDLSTTELLQRTAMALGHPSKLLPVPQGMLEFGFRLLGKNDLSRRLCGSLQVDISKTCKLLEWSPPVSVDVGLRLTAKAFLRSMQQ